ncbi:MAG: TMEM143 family protein [Desulfobacterales bacterium]
MKKYQIRNRFIPFRKSDIIEMCVNDSRLSEHDQKLFIQFCHILKSLIHFEFHDQVETLKDCYSPFNPDADTWLNYDYSEQEKKSLQKKLVEGLDSILDAANFQKITETDLEEALKEESLFKIRLGVDFNDFEEVIFYQRGESFKEEIRVKYFGLKKTPLRFTNYDRVMIYIKFKDEDYFKAKKQKTLYFTPGSTIIKLFQNVPKADLEMLFPNSEVRMKTIDKLIIGIPAAVSGIAVIATKLGASILLIASVISFWLGLNKREVKIDQQHLIALALGLATLGGFLFKQVNKFKNRKIRFMKALSDNLYFKNLDNNTGVFHHLVDAAEEEEFKEAILAYYFLLVEDRELTITALDETVERWFENKHNCRINFEIEDAFKKLKRWGLVDLDKDIIRRKNLNDAMQQLDEIWDNYFPYHKVDELPKMS